MGSFQALNLDTKRELNNSYATIYPTSVDIMSIYGIMAPFSRYCSSNVLGFDLFFIPFKKVLDLTFFIPFERFFNKKI